MQKFGSTFGTLELTDERRAHILTFHPEVKQYYKYFAKALLRPEIIRRSKSDPQVLILYYKIPRKKYLAIVIKINARKFILTAYLASKIQHSNL